MWSIEPHIYDLLLYTYFPMLVCGHITVIPNIEMTWFTKYFKVAICHTKLKDIAVFISFSPWF